MKTTLTRVLVVLALALSMPAVAVGQARVGVATTVVGPVTVTRVASSPAPLKFKDDVLLNDRVATGDKAFARMLLGGKATVTVREHSTVTITEVPGLSTIDLASGRISVAVDKSRMRPGEVVEIKTPHAVSGIRGTIVVAEVSDGVSTITVLRGLVDVYRRDPATGKAIGVAVSVGARESVTVKAGVLPKRPHTISTQQARKLSDDFTAPVQPVSPADAMVADEVSRASGLVSGLSGGAAVRTDVATTPVAPTGAVGTSSPASPTLSQPLAPTGGPIASPMPPIASPNLPPTPLPLASPPPPPLVQKITQPVMPILNNPLK
jgi:hypothetical protein